jgi:hypothetical protein
MVYDPRFMQQLQQQLNQLHATSRTKDRQLAELNQRCNEMQSVINALTAMRDGSSNNPEVEYIEQIPGRRVPYDLLIDIPVGANETTEVQDSVQISQEGPFIAVCRFATFQSTFEFRTTDPETAEQARLSGRSYGRYRPIHSAWDANDAQHNAVADTAGWYLTHLLNMAGMAAGSQLPAGTLGLPSNMSSFRTMQTDGRVTVINAGSSYPRQNISVPSSMWTRQINSPFELGALDFFERGETITVKYQPLHVNNPPAGNVAGPLVMAGAGALGLSDGYPWIEGQFDAHEGIATPGSSEIDDTTGENLPKTLQTDSVERLPNGILTIGWHGYRIIQPIGPAR